MAGVSILIQISVLWILGLLLQVLLVRETADASSDVPIAGEHALGLACRIIAGKRVM